MQTTVNLDPGQRQIYLRPTAQGLIQFPSASSISSPLLRISMAIWKAW